MWQLALLLLVASPASAIEFTPQFSGDRVFAAGADREFLDRLAPEMFRVLEAALLERGSPENCVGSLGIQRISIRLNAQPGQSQRVFIRFINGERSIFQTMFALDFNWASRDLRDAFFQENGRRSFNIDGLSVIVLARLRGSFLEWRGLNCSEGT